jgi:hypothetical protein
MFSSPSKIISYWKTLWEAALSDQQKNKLKMMLDGGNLVFYFRYQNEVYGAGESSRVVFAKMKDPTDEDHTPGWLKETNFTATNLTQLGQGSASQMLFTDKELNKIDVLSRDEAMNALEEFFEKERNKNGEQV